MPGVWFSDDGIIGGINGGGTGGGAVGSVTFPAVLSAGRPGLGGTKLGGMLVFDAMDRSGKAIGLAGEGFIMLLLANADA